jgi:HAD superfamily hydrolase (TIGR01509 family)
MWKAIFWDNDGVLVDTEGLYYQATRDVLATVDVLLSEQQYVDLFLREAKGAWHLAEARGVPANQLAALKQRRDHLYASLIDTQATLITGADQVVRRLATQFRMAVVTSSEHFDHIHRDRTFLDLFEFVMTPAHYRQSKPHPEPYLRAVERMGLAAGDCLAIEDSERGVRAAKAAGLTCWVVPCGISRSCCFDEVDRIFPDLAALADALWLFRGAPSGPIDRRTQR